MDMPPFVQPLKDIWILDSSGLVQIKLLLTIVCKFSSLWNIHVRVQLLGHMASPYLVLNGSAKLFSRVAILAI